MMNYNFLPLYPNDNYYFVVPSVFYVYYPYPMFSQVCDNLPSINHPTSLNNHSISYSLYNNNLIDLTDSNVFQKTQNNCVETIKKHKIKKKKKKIVLVKKGFLNRKVNPGKQNSNKKLNKLIKNDILNINNDKRDEQILTRKKNIKSSYYNYEKEMEEVYQDKFMFFMFKNFPNNFTFENFYISKHIRAKKKYLNAIEDMNIFPVPCDSSQDKCKKVWSPEYNCKNDVDNYIKTLTKINEYKMNEEDMLEFLKENNYNTSYSLFLVKTNDIKYQEFVNSKNKLN